MTCFTHITLPFPHKEHTRIYHTICIRGCGRWSIGFERQKRCCLQLIQGRQDDNDKTAFWKLHTFRNWGSYKRYFKWSGMKEANMGRTLTPADFLINEDGIIVDMYRAFDVAKNPCIPFDRIEGK